MIKGSKREKTKDTDGEGASTSTRPVRSARTKNKNLVSRRMKLFPRKRNQRKSFLKVKVRRKLCSLNLLLLSPSLLTLPM